MERRTLATVGAVAAGALYGWLQWLGRTYGATPAERRRTLPGDGLCVQPQAQTTHGITIDAPASHVWPWLVQMGWGRGQWYTARWVDRLLFPANGPSADHVHPEWQDLKVGDRVLDGPPATKCSFIVAQMEPDRYLVLHSREHLPPRWAETFGASIDWSWAFVLDEVSGCRTRLVVRSRLRVRPRWVEAVYLAVIVPADFVMSRQMLRGLTTRVEAMTARESDVAAGGRHDLVVDVDGRQATGRAGSPGAGPGARQPAARTPERGCFPSRGPVTSS